MIRRPPRSTLSSSSAASDVYKRQYQRRVRGPIGHLKMTEQGTSSSKTPMTREEFEVDGWMDVVGSGSIWLKHHCKGAGHDAEHPTRPEVGQAALIKYVGRVQSTGSVFEDTGDTAVKVRVGDDDLPTGLEMCLRLMCVGGKVSTKLIARHAYGEEGRAGVPADTDVEFDLELVELGDMLPDTDDKLEVRVAGTAEDIDKGTVRYNAGNLEAAAKLWERACTYLAGEQAGEVVALRVRAENNATMALLKLTQLNKALAHAHTALELDAGNSKALWRAASISNQLQEWSDATKYVTRGLELHPDEKSFQTLSTTIQRAIKQHKKTEKKMFSKMMTSAAPAEGAVAETTEQARSLWLYLVVALLVLLLAILAHQFAGR
eukprot:TRINITY_DN50333_c0_g1_i1.p1 TRINITY_DN50333_c0_g1~~TRINITY_DN50333_c0_g1_i1.p1  ORF type:complete len:376 (-),score=86.70 TRINITY_DN50333_c0_g1_i1:112-1239(-)